jgi:hypothetical protein
MRPVLIAVAENQDRNSLARSQKMKDYRVFSVVAVVSALAVVQFSADAAWAKTKKASAPAQTSQQVQPRQQAQAPQPNNCPGGVSKGCGPGSCRC